MLSTPLRTEVKIGWVVFRGEWPDRFRSFKRATLGITWNTEKYPKTPDRIILQTKALGLSLHHCRGKWDSHNCYHLLNPPSKSRSALQIKYLEYLCSFSCIIVHHYSLEKSLTVGCGLKRLCARLNVNGQKKSVWHLKLQVSSLLNYTCGKIFHKKLLQSQYSSFCPVRHSHRNISAAVTTLQKYWLLNIGWKLVVVHKAAE